MKNITVKDLNTCGIKSVTIAEGCKVSEPAVAIWKRKGVIPSPFQKKALSLFTKQVKVVNKIALNLAKK